MSRPIPLPPAHARKLRLLAHELETLRRPYQSYHGKRLRRFPRLISVPLGNKWRAIFVETAAGLRFCQCLSHQAYNKMKLEKFV